MSKINMHTVIGAAQLLVGAVAAGGATGVIHIGPEWLAVLIALQGALSGGKNTATGMNGVH